MKNYSDNREAQILEVALVNKRTTNVIASSSTARELVKILEDYAASAGLTLAVVNTPSLSEGYFDKKVVLESGETIPLENSDKFLVVHKATGPRTPQEAQWALELMPPSITITINESRQKPQFEIER